MQKQWRSLFEVLVKKHNVHFVHYNLHHNKLGWRTTTLWSCIVPQFLCQISPSLTQYLMVSENLYVRVLRWIMKWAASIFNLQSVSWTILQMPDLSVFYIVPTKYNKTFSLGVPDRLLLFFWFLKCSYEFFMLIWSCLYFLLEPLKNSMPAITVMVNLLWNDMLALVLLSWVSLSRTNFSSSQNCAKCWWSRILLKPLVS